MEAKEVFYHDCRVLGPHTRIPRAVFASKDGPVKAIYHKCPFCSATAGDMITDPKQIEAILAEWAEDEMAIEVVEVENGQTK
jgi:hypothetical protein